MDYLDAYEVIPLLKPHLNQGDTITGVGNHLFIKTNTEYYQQINNIIKQFDKAPKQLLLNIMMNASSSQLQSKFGLPGPFIVGKTISSKETKLVYSTNYLTTDNKLYQLRLQEDFPTHLEAKIAKKIIMSKYSHSFKQTNNIQSNKKISKSKAVAYDFVEYGDEFSIKIKLVKHMAVVELVAAAQIDHDETSEIDHNELISKFSVPLNQWVVIHSTTTQPEEDKKFIYRSDSLASQNQITLIKINLL